MRHASCCVAAKVARAVIQSPAETQISNRAFAAGGSKDSDAGDGWICCARTNDLFLVSMAQIAEEPHRQRSCYQRIVAFAGHKSQVGRGCFWASRNRQILERCLAL